MHYVQCRRNGTIHLYPNNPRKYIKLEREAFRSSALTIALGRAFYHFRRIRGCSVNALSKATAIDRRTIHRFEAGTGSLSTDRLLMLLKVIPNGHLFFIELTELMNAN